MGKIDNSNEAGKIALRRKFIPDNAAVLDCFCGTGKMYQGAYKNAHRYIGLDNTKVHDENTCFIVDNLRYVKNNDISGFNVFDLDAYGCPRILLYTILGKCIQDDLTFFITDGLAERYKMSGDMPRFVRALEKVGKKFNVPGILRWYVDMFGTMLLDIEERFRYKTTKAVYFHNTNHTVYYWCLKLSRMA